MLKILGNNKIIELYISSRFKKKICVEKLYKVIVLSFGHDLEKLNGIWDCFVRYFLDIFSFFEAIFCDEFPSLANCLLDFETSGAILDFWTNYEI
jgi:hypothetical protein